MAPIIVDDILIVPLRMSPILIRSCKPPDGKVPHRHSEICTAPQRIFMEPEAEWGIIWGRTGMPQQISLYADVTRHVRPVPEYSPSDSTWITPEERLRRQVFDVPNNYYRKDFLCITSLIARKSLFESSASPSSNSSWSSRFSRFLVRSHFFRFKDILHLRETPRDFLISRTSLWRLRRPLENEALFHCPRLL